VEGVLLIYLWLFYTFLLVSERPASLCLSLTTADGPTLTTVPCMECSWWQGSALTIHCLGSPRWLS